MTTVTSSSSNWLTRLRTSKGFPDSTHTDLEHFLSTSLPQSHSPPPKPPPADVTSPHPLPPHDVISNVLSDLFCFNNNNTPDTRKTSRKQINPKQCVFAKNSVVSSSPKVRTSRKQVRPKVCVVAKNPKVRECGEEEVEEEEWEDFRDFTETEVTVIDTSVASWKFEKVLYRRKNEWRVGDKRRRDGGEEEDGERKKKNKKLKLCGEWKTRDKENAEKTKKKMKKKKKKLKFVNKEGDVAGSKFVQLGDMLFLFLFMDAP